MKQVVIFTVLLVVVNCSCHPPITRIAGYPSRYAYSCVSAEDNTDIILITNSCDTTMIFHNNEGQLISLQLDDCTAGIIKFEKKDGDKLLTFGYFKSTGQKKKRRFDVESKTSPGQFTNTYVRAYMTQKYGTWIYYDTSGIILRKEIYD